VVEKEVIKEVMVPGETIIVEKEVIKEVKVPGETIVVEKEVIKEVPVEKVVVVEKEVIKEVMVPGETIIVEKEVIKEVKVPGETIVVEKEVIKEVPVEKVVVVEKEVITEVQAAGAEKVLTVGTAQAIPNFNPWVGGGGVRWSILDAVKSRLAYPNPHTKTWEPDLAERWDISPDATSYTFYLRKNARWHDGAAVTAKDVLFTNMVYLNPDLTVRQTKSYMGIKGAKEFNEGKTDEISGITILDDHTIRFELEKPSAIFFSLCCENPDRTIEPVHILGKVPYADLPGQSFFRETLTNSGPFRFVRLVPGQLIELEANPDYFMGRPNIDRIIFRLIRTTPALEAAMLRGDIQLGFNVPSYDSETWLRFIEHPDFIVAGAEAIFTQAYLFNDRKDFLTKDRRIRKAFMHALDRQKLIDVFRDGDGQIANTVMIHRWYQKPEWRDFYPYDPAKAKALLKEAGWDSGRTITVLTGPTRSERDRGQLASEQQMLEAVGIKIKFEELEPAVWSARVYGPTHDYEAIRSGGWSASGDPATLYDTHVGGRNPSGWATPELDALAAKGATSLDRAERIMIYQNIAEQMIEDLPWAVVFQRGERWAMSKKLIIPFFSDLPEATSFADVPVGQTFSGSRDWTKFHVWEWDMKQ
jgi:ABC-type transport system substrate-binding protein